MTSKCQQADHLVLLQGWNHLPADEEEGPGEARPGRVDHSGHETLGHREDQQAGREVHRLRDVLQLHALAAAVPWGKKYRIWQRS